jgi:Universal stress protein family
MYSTIVVGYDESESSKAALKEASLRVKNLNGKLYLVHAVYFDQEEFAILPSQMEKRFEMGTHVCRTAASSPSSARASRPKCSLISPKARRRTSSRSGPTDGKA